MILIADGGSTKTSWCSVDSAGNQLFFETEGYNPYFVDTLYIIESLSRSLPVDFLKENVKEVHFYGAGCSTDKSVLVSNAIERVFPASRAFVELDLLAAARALLGNNPGFAAILGTGTNSCLYDGKKMIQHIDSLGFLLGDEGSAGYIGKKLLIDYMRGYLPEKIRAGFIAQFGITPDEIMHTVYTQPLPNRYCAGFAKYVGDHIDEEYFYTLVKDSFKDFFTNIVCGYMNYRSYTFNCIGSLGYSFQTILAEVAESFGMHTGRFIQAPIADLVKYHMANFPGD